MAKTVTKKKTTLPRWSDTDVEMLLAAVKQAPSASKAFEQVAKELGKSKGTVQQKYYSIQRKNGATGGVVPGKGQRGRRRMAGQSSVDVSSMDTNELVKLAGEVQAEVKRRQDELAKAMQVFG